MNELFHYIYYPLHFFSFFLQSSPMLSRQVKTSKCFYDFYQLNYLFLPLLLLCFFSLHFTIQWILAKQKIKKQSYNSPLSTLKCLMRYIVIALVHRLIYTYTGMVWKVRKEKIVMVANKCMNLYQNQSTLLVCGKKN